MRRDMRIAALSVFLLLMAVTLANAQSESVLYNFCQTAGCADGRAPYAGLIMDSANNLYGTTQVGGAYGYGTVFEVSPDGTEAVLHSFGGGTDGMSAEGTLLMDAEGNIYGTTASGGSNGRGTVFEVSSSGSETVLHNFGYGTDGAAPYAGLIMDAKGNLYGTTTVGGVYGGGTVFELSAGGSEKILHSFNSKYGTDGSVPYGGLVMDAKGNLYGTTSEGGAYGAGTAFKVKRNGVEKVLHSFAKNANDGVEPFAGLIMDGTGSLYGTTLGGGSNYPHYGTVFKLSPSGKETILHSLVGSDGANPAAGLLMDGSGNLYGTTTAGGAYDRGTVFEVSASETETVLHNFGATYGGIADDGTYPEAGLIMDKAGNLYSTTFSGGDYETSCETYGCGTVFTVTP